MATRYSSSWRFLRTRGSRSPYVSRKPPVGRTVSHFLALLLSSSFFLRLLRACLSIIIYLHRCFFLLLLPFSSFFFFFFSLRLSSSSSSLQYTFTFPSSVACPGILVLLDSRSLTFPCFFPRSVFFFFSDSSANIPPPCSIFGLLPAFFRFSRYTLGPFSSARSLRFIQSSPASTWIFARRSDRQSRVKCTQTVRQNVHGRTVQNTVMCYEIVLRWGNVTSLWYTTTRCIGTIMFFHVPYRSFQFLSN